MFSFRRLSESCEEGVASLLWCAHTGLWSMQLLYCRKKRLLLFIVVKYWNVFSFVSPCGHLWCRSQRFDCILLVFIRRWCWLVTRHLLNTMLHCDWLVFSSCDWCVSILTVLACCSFSGPLSYGSPIVVFLDHGRSCFWNFYSTIPVDVVRVKS